MNACRPLFYLLLLLCAVPALAREVCQFCKGDVNVRSFPYRSGSLPVCARCATTRPRCDLCGSPSGEKVYRDGRQICAVCKQTGVFQVGRAQTLAREANAFLTRLLGPKHTATLPPIQLVDLDEMQTKSNEGGRAVDAVAFYRPYNPEMVYVLSGETELDICQHLVHELTHAWQSRACPPQDRALKEGFASWMQYQYLVSKGAMDKARLLPYHQDPDYGASLALLLKREAALGQARFLQAVQKATRLSDV